MQSCCHISLTSKKPAEVRYHELLESISGPLLELAGHKVCEWAQSKPHAPLLVQMAESLEGEWGETTCVSLTMFSYVYVCILDCLSFSLAGDLCVLYRPLVEMLSEEFDPTAHLAVDPCGHQVVRRLIRADSKREHGQGGMSL